MLIDTHKLSCLAIAGALVLSVLVSVDRAAATGPVALQQRVGPIGPAGPPPTGVTPQPAAPDAAPRSTDGRPALRLRPKDPDRSAIQVVGTCMPYAYSASSGIGFDEFLEEAVGVSYYGGVDCDFALDSIYGEVGVVDRSPSFNGQSFNGVWLGSSGVFGFGYSASGSGGFSVRARYYNGARHVEPIVDLTLWAPGGTYWDFCGFVPGMQYYACEGLGTSVLHIVLGAFVRSTGLTQACRDQFATVDAEQARLVLPSGSTPASTQILGLILSIRSRVIDFKRDLCSTTQAGASGFATTQGQQLWTTAVTAAKNATTNNDDRPLYWARLSMTAALSQWKPASFIPDRTGLQRSLDWAARGMNSHDFTTGPAKKVLVSGFDPFGLDGSWIMSGNPSAAAVLALDNTTLNGAEVQVVVFPVRYDDFTTIPSQGVLGIVESAVAQHLASGPQRATMITTVSQQPSDQFDLECWSGRYRTSGADNRNMPSGGSPSNPFEPGYHAPGKPFAATTLPVGSMQVVTSFPVVVDKTLREHLARGLNPVQKTVDPCPGVPGGPIPPPPPTSGWLAVDGSGGGYLSNEVAYRVTEMRDYFGSPVRAGHIHTPELDEQPPGLNEPATVTRRNLIVNQYRLILSAAIAAV